ncbi:MAG: hypothetical protein DRP87_09400 [Spirochaetes bacterium]|mgnify:CR=1 FL=1|nr:MAG: hypothetical protein DRP87_09400 [Spirochaetota bacterium]
MIPAVIFTKTVIYSKVKKVEKYFSRLYIKILLIFLLQSCGLDYPAPYLYLDVDSVYTSPQVEIRYYFKSERNPQLCRVTLYKMNGSVFEQIYNSEERLPERGILKFNLENGIYRLRFSLLSERGFNHKVLPFLDRTYEFEVKT